jgi:hypothetical protein
MIFTSSLWSSFLKRMIQDIIKSFIFFLQKFYSAARMQRESNSGTMDLSKDRVSHGQLMKGDLRNIFWADNMKHLKVSEGMGNFQIWYAIDPRMIRTRKDKSSEKWNCF